MIRLIESGLFGDRLVAVNTPVMVQRYNSCLAQIGLPKTKLKDFHIDGWGWSPEIAEELHDSFYLSHGMANPYGIIITPEQAEASIYFPYQSFDWDVHKAVYQTYAAQISDITSQCGIWFEMDQRVSAYRRPADLLMIDVFTIKFKTVDNVLEAAQEQRALIQKFNEHENAWADESLRTAIIESGKKHGDLRFRAIDLAPIPFGHFRSFYTLAFNGMYVFKNLMNNKPLLIYGNNKSKISGETSHDNVEYNLNDGGLITYLYGQNLITDDVTYYKEHPYLIEMRMEQMLMVAAEELKIKAPKEVPAEAKKNIMLDKLVRADAIPEVYFDMENLLNALQQDKKAVVTDPMRQELLHPVSTLESNEKIVLWHLLSNMNNNPVLRYLFDKPRFFTEYREWAEEKQAWAVDSILKHRYIFKEIIK